MNVFRTRSRTKNIHGGVNLAADGQGEVHCLTLTKETPVNLADPWNGISVGVRASIFIGNMAAIIETREFIKFRSTASAVERKREREREREGDLATVALGSR